MQKNQRIMVSLGNVSGKCSLVVGIGGYQYLLKLKFSGEIL